MRVHHNGPHTLLARTLEVLELLNWGAHTQGLVNDILQWTTKGALDPVVTRLAGSGSLRVLLPVLLEL